MRRSLQVTLWTSAGHAGHDELPLLVVHDGPEYAVHASLLAYLDRRVHDGAIPPLHAALIGPGRRDEEYAANPAYARALAEEILPAVSARLRVFDDSRARVGVGASLGGLALLHAQLQYPSLFGGLFLQSSSFLRGGVDGHERWLSRYDHVVRFVDALVSQRTATLQGVAVTLTCGLAEENLQSNRDVHRALLESGHDATLVEVRDAHNWTAWRDSLDPHLGDLLRGLWGSRRAQG